MGISRGWPAEAGLLIGTLSLHNGEFQSVRSQLLVYGGSPSFALSGSG